MIVSLNPLLARPKGSIWLIKQSIGIAPFHNIGQPHPLVINMAAFKSITCGVPENLEIIEENKNLKEELLKLKKLNDERIGTILKVAEESSKDVRTPIRANAVIEQIYAEV
ncbi:MAG: hypothetical protein EZS28_010722 [Streblomastix strix]|uniref:Uncharacterized protein n=1 Tax=Streblomastix strix TaxID=222440 RepID=A0A5J4WFT5_9EUKA|nr:MAG: hypothetical protein EZS28_010722 [Streblomastix strix]